MYTLPFSVALYGCEPEFPEAFDYLIDRTIVPAIRITPNNGPPETERLVEALVLSPHEILSREVEVCGYRDDIALSVSAECFGEASLIETVARELPASFSLPAPDYDCESNYSYGGYTTTTGSGYGYAYGGSGYIPYDCRSSVPLRVIARSEEDEGSSFIELAFDRRHRGIPFDVSTADPRIEVIEGEVVPGGEVRLRFSVAHAGSAPADTGLEETGLEETGGSGAFTGYSSSYNYGTSFAGGYFGGGPPDDMRFRWYVDAGELLGTGRTGATSSDELRHYAENTLRLPEDAHGSLRVAVVLATGAPVWSVLTLEVP